MWKRAFLVVDGGVRWKFDLYKGMRNIRNGNYTDDYKDSFFII